jgi:hypothetical protein
MSEDYRIVALGREEFVLPFAASGFEFSRVDILDEGLKYISGQDLALTLFILDEEIIDDEKKLEESESRGANILVLKGWGKSKMAERKIRQASIKAVGVDMKETRA